MVTTTSKQAPAKESKWISHQEAAEMLGIDPRTLQNWRTSKKENQPRYNKVGHLVRYLRADVEQFIADSFVEY